MRFSYRSSEIQIPHPASLASSSVLWTPARAWTRRRDQRAACGSLAPCGSFGHYQIILFARRESQFEKQPASTADALHQQQRLAAKFEGRW